jgi:arylsulfatase A-like enzyme
MGAAEGIAVLHGTGLAYENPVMQTLGIEGRYAILGILLALALRRARPSWNLGVLAAWTSAGAACAILFFWTHSALLYKVSLLKPISLLASLGVVLASLALGWTFKRAFATRPRGPIWAGVVFLLAFPLHALLRFDVGGGEAPPSVEARPGLPDITLVVIDTLRADHVSCYGYPVPTTPALDALAGRGMRFASAWAQAPWTRPSMASLHCGFFPTSHGTNSTTDKLPSSSLTLAEALRNQGYRTGAFSANVNISRSFGFDQGFGHFHLAEDGLPLVRDMAWGKLAAKLARWTGTTDVAQGSKEDQSAAGPLTDKVIDWLGEGDDLPEFTYVHYIDPHAPYDPPEFLLEGGRPSIADLQASFRWESGILRYPFGERPPLEGDGRERVVRLYDAEIRYCDREFQRLLDHLEATGRLGPEDWLIVTSDHGEEFYEHLHWGHGQSLFEEQLHVPLVLVGPGARGGAVVEQPVNLLDLYATLLGWAGAEVPADCPSRSLQPFMKDPEMEDGRILFAERIMHEGQGAQTAVRKGSRKLIETPDRSAADEAMLHLHFDLASNPGERLEGDYPPAEGTPFDKQNPVFQAPADLLKLLVMMRDFALVTAFTAEKVELDEDTLRALQSLGYIGDDED